MNGRSPKPLIIFGHGIVPNTQFKRNKKEPEATCPPTAQFAVRMAPVLGKNIHATMTGKSLNHLHLRNWDKWL